MAAYDSIPFDRAVDYYDQTRGFPPGVERDVALLLARLGALDGSSRVLEVGVGTGRIALPLAAHAGAIYGLDLSRPMMERLRSKQQDERVFLVQGDACRLPYPAATFHATIAVHVFHLIRDWRTVVNEIARVLRPDGRLISAWGGARYGDLWREVRERVGVEHRVGIRDREELEAHLLATGCPQNKADRNPDPAHWGTNAEKIDLTLLGKHVTAGQFLAWAGNTGPGGKRGSGGPNTHLHIFWARRDPTDNEWYFFDPYGIYALPTCYPAGVTGAITTPCARYPVAWKGGKPQYP